MRRRYEQRFIRHSPFARRIRCRLRYRSRRRRGQPPTRRWRSPTVSPGARSTCCSMRCAGFSTHRSPRRRTHDGRHRPGAGVSADRVGSRTRALIGCPLQRARRRATIKPKGDDRSLFASVSKRLVASVTTAASRERRGICRTGCWRERRGRRRRERRRARGRGRRRGRERERGRRRGSLAPWDCAVRRGEHGTNASTRVPIPRVPFGLMRPQHARSRQPLRASITSAR
jgi:hypothetical protein